LWWVLDDPRLSASSRRFVEEAGNEIILSAASGYEIALKTAIGRLRLPEAPGEYIASRLATEGFSRLAISLDHALRAGVLPLIHRDPFDRILIAQSQLEDLPIITTDPAIGRYDVETIW
jgi:PIN domain nuclease of toxin-antitoxin system